jgi:hypothetical protein
LGDLPQPQVPPEYDKEKTGLDELEKPFRILKMKFHHLFLSFLFTIVTLNAGPATEKVAFESDTRCMTKEELKEYMGRGPDESITPHLWRYSGSWTSTKFSDGMETFNTVDISFGMLTDSHKYGVMEYTWSIQ